MSSRTLRRHHRARMIQKARNLFARWGEDEGRINRNAPRLADNLQWCSCYSCGNPRRWNGFTVYSHRSEIRTPQEIRSDLDWAEWKKEIVNVGP